MSSYLEIDNCFVKEEVHRTAESKHPDLIGRLVRLTNYDHVTADLFTKLKTVLSSPELSRFKKPTPKICLACCQYLSDLHVESKANKRKYGSSVPETSLTVANTSFNKLIDELKTRNFTNDEMNTLMHTVGERLAPLAASFVAILNKTTVANRLNDITAMNYHFFWNTTFQPLKNILLGMINGNGYVYCD